MKTTTALLSTALMGLSFWSTAMSAVISCGDTDLGTRVALVGGGLQQGYCHAQEGNLTNADISTLGLVQLGKEVAQNGDVASTLLDFTISNSARTTGNWRIDSGTWNSWDHLYLGLHFGGGSSAANASPDSFVVELARPGSAGTWTLSGPDNFRATGLSNIYLLARSPTHTRLTEPQSVPEPTGLALATLGLLAVAGMRRKTQQS